MNETTLTFLGTAAVLPGAGRESASFLINGTFLVDCGWNCAIRMQQYGCDPLAVETLYFTHCHHDHYLGLPGLLFYRAMAGRRVPDLPPLRIVGPPDDLPIVVERARQFLQADRFPEAWHQPSLRYLDPGSPYETEVYRVETVCSLHGVTGVCSRFTDSLTGASIAFTGDTAPNEEFVRLARGADLMIHEASLRPETPDDRLNGHSRAADAARAARDAGAGRLLLIHLHGDHAQRSLEAARKVFPETDLAEEGATLAFAPTE